MKVVLIIILFLLLAGWDVPKLLKAKQKKDLAVYTVLMAAGLLLSILVAYHVYVPTPSKKLTEMLKPFSSLLK